MVDDQGYGGQRGGGQVGQGKTSIRQGCQTDRSRLNLVVWRQSRYLVYYWKIAVGRGVEVPSSDRSALKSSSLAPVKVNYWKIAVSSVNGVKVPSPGLVDGGGVLPFYTTGFPPLALLLILIVNMYSRKKAQKNAIWWSVFERSVTFFPFHCGIISQNGNSSDESSRSQRNREVGHLCEWLPATAKKDPEHDPPAHS